MSNQAAAGFRLKATKDRNDRGERPAFQRLKFLR